MEGPYKQTSYRYAYYNLPHKLIPIFLYIRDDMSLSTCGFDKQDLINTGRFLTQDIEDYMHYGLQSGLFEPMSTRNPAPCAVL